MPGPEKVRVLVVDDSSSLRAILSRGLEREGLEVVGGASDPYMARELIRLLQPQVLSLDLQMPSMDGLTFLGRLMAYHPLPVVVFASLDPAQPEQALRALELGAVEVLAKPAGPDPEALPRLAAALRRAARVQPRRRPPLPAPLPLGPNLDPRRVVAIGASTGGTTALGELIPKFPRACPPVLIVQHMPAGFTGPLARRLDQLGPLRVKEAADGDKLESGLALLAPAGLHLRLAGGGTHVQCFQGPPVHHVSPSVDVLFDSVAQAVGARALGILLTGMGRDGARGLLSIRQAGGQTLAQDEASSAVWGMPGAAQRLGAVQEVLPLSNIAYRALDLLQRREQAP